MSLDTRTMTRLFSILFIALATACSGNTSDGAGGSGGAGGGGQGGAGGDEPGCVINEDCDDEQECTTDVCLPDGTCESTPADDETECSLGVCVLGACEPVESALPCTEEGIRQAVETGGGPYGFLCEGPQTVTTQAEIVIDSDVVLDGLGNLTVDAGGQHRPFSVLENVTAELRRIAVTGGAAPDLDGGGIFNDGALTLVETSVSDCTAPRFGGGIANSGALTMTRCSISGNAAGQGGGGVSHVGSGALSMVDTTISSNEAGGDGGQGDGGGVFNQGRVTLTGCTVSGNEATGDGGGLAVANSATLVNTTISGNTAAQHGGGIRNNSALSITHCTLSGNTAAAGPAISNAAFVSAIGATVVDGQCDTEMSATWNALNIDFNVETPGDTCNFTGSNDQVDVTPQDLGLGPLQDNGGPTQTHALDATSVAVDVIDEPMCETENDQRGVARPQGVACDVGAFELGP